MYRNHPHQEYGRHYSQDRNGNYNRQFHRHEFEYGEERIGRDDGDNFRRLEHGAEIDPDGYYERRRYRGHRYEHNEPYRPQRYPEFRDRPQHRHQGHGNYHSARDYEAYWEDERRPRRPHHHFREWEDRPQPHRAGFRQAYQQQWDEPNEYGYRRHHAPDLRPGRLDYNRNMYPDLESGHFHPDNGPGFDMW